LINIERYNTDVIDLNIAKLRLILDARGSDLNLLTPHCYEKFIQPVVTPQAEFQIPEPMDLKQSIDDLVLHIHSEILPERAPTERLLFRSETWELWMDGDGKYIFKGIDQFPQIQIVVDSSFTTGFAMGDFSSKTDEGIYPIKYLDINLFSVWLARLGDLLLHASGVMVDGKGYCFLGESGSGKSTLASALVPSPRVTILGEDQVILRYLDGRFWIYGTPWHQNPGMCTPEGTPLEKLFFLNRFSNPGVEKCLPFDGITRLLQTAFVPYYQPSWVTGIIDRLELLAELIPFHMFSYQLGSDPLQQILQA
jgi:hypothetical protein